MPKNNILVVGAGFSGSTIARCLAEAGLNVTIIEKRGHIAGNAYDAVNHLGIRVHSYGPHIFHTSNESVVQFLSRFTEWIEYRHKVRAVLKDGREVVMPPNLQTVSLLGEENIVNTLYRPYTKKMWGLELEQLDPGIAKRVSARDDLNEDYFPNDIFQAMPRKGYTHLIREMLDHSNIKLILNTCFDSRATEDFDHTFNSMPIDEYFQFD